MACSTSLLLSYNPNAADEWRGDNREATQAEREFLISYLVCIN